MGSAGDILDFWFGARGSPERGTLRSVWFRKDPQFDEEIRRRFGDLHAAATRGEFDAWHKMVTKEDERVKNLEKKQKGVFDRN